MDLVDELIDQGKDWLSLWQLWPPKFEQNLCIEVSKEKIIKQIKNDYAEVFEPGMGNYKGDPIHLSIKPGVKPIFMPVRTDPFAQKDKVSDEIKRLVEAKRIKPLGYPNGSSPKTRWNSSIMW